MLKIRPFTFNDTDAILTIVNHTILNSSSIYDYDARTLEQQNTILEDKLAKNFPFIVAEVDNKVVGFGTYGDFRYKKGYQFTVEHSLYIDDRFHGLGIGKLLLKELIDNAKRQNIHNMIAVIDSENQISIAMHEKFGFETIGTIKEVGYKFDKWLDTVLMQLVFR